MKIEGTRPVGSSRPVSKAGAASSVSTTGGPAPVRRVEDTAQIFGIPDHELTPRVRAAITKLLDEVSDLRREVDLSKRRMEELERLADEDTLIPVLNRRAFIRELSRARSVIERYGTKASLVYLDMNNFKEINDSHGHAAGDAALRQVADILKKNVRASDVVGRLGGDEFGAILDRAPRDQALRRAEMIAHAIETSPVKVERQSIDLSVSFGVCELTAHEDPETTLSGADKAMYENKKGRGGAPKAPKR